ncbi:serine/threonine-protein kinase HAL4/sat4 [Podila humilis]|nr:serine/threonine-protein kinase HAL4/sat4 [Podila humilis]
MDPDPSAVFSSSLHLQLPLPPDPGDVNTFSTQSISPPSIPSASSVVPTASSPSREQQQHFSSTPASLLVLPAACTVSIPTQPCTSNNTPLEQTAATLSFLSQPSSPLKPRLDSHSDLHSETPFPLPPQADADHNIDKDTISTTAILSQHSNHSSLPSFPLHQQQQQQQQQPSSSQTLTSPLCARSRNSHQSRAHHLLADIPSATAPVAAVGDTLSPAGGGPSSASPSTWSIASSDTGISSTNTSVIENRARFEQLPNGTHRHHLSVPKRQQFLANQVRRLRELLDGKKEREDVVVATPPPPPPPSSSSSAILHQQQHQYQHQQHHQQVKTDVFESPLSLMNEKNQDMESEQHQPSSGAASPSLRRRNTVKMDFVQKYGELQQVVGKGAFGTVRLSVKRNPDINEESVYAIKEFKYAYGESQKMYMRRLTSEFCIASSLKHINVIQTMNLLQLHADTYSQVMEYCAGGDMHSLIANAGTLGESESNCFFAQLINGVAFLHAMGVVHRDLKPENLLLTSEGCLKIADFGNSEVFRMPWEKKARSSASIRGSGPFIAPEEFTNKTFDARKVDMWACGVIYMCMRIGRYTWHEASDGDPVWDGYLYRRQRYLELENNSPTTPSSSSEIEPDPLNNSNTHHNNSNVPEHLNLASLEQVSHITLAWPIYIADVMENLLEPDTRKRWQATNVLGSEWFLKIENCHPSERPPEIVLDESEFEILPSRLVGSTKVVQEDTATAICRLAKEERTRGQEFDAQPAIG